MPIFLGGGGGVGKWSFSDIFTSRISILLQITVYLEPTSLCARITLICLQYPSKILQFKYDDSFSIRGLHCDVRKVR